MVQVPDIFVLLPHPLTLLQFSLQPFSLQLSSMTAKFDADAILIPKLDEPQTGPLRLDARGKIEVVNKSPTRTMNQAEWDMGQHVKTCECQARNYGHLTIT